MPRPTPPRGVPAQPAPPARGHAARALARDPVMGRVIAAVGPLAEYYRERTDFETVTRIIVGQQLSYAAATTIWGRVRALEPRWRAATVAELAPQALRAAGLSRSKTDFILGAARRVADGDLDLRRVRRLDDAAAAEVLRGIKGFGPWSVEMYLIFALDRPDVFSVGDAGLRRAVCSLYSLRPTDYERRIGPLADRWRPWRSHACRYLWAWLEVDAG